MRAVVVLAWLGVLLGCRPEFELGPSDRAINGAPRADAGTGTVVQVLENITLDGRRSVDLDGTIVAYRWSVAEAPADSVATITGSTQALASFTPDTFGIYTFELEVEDDAGAKDRSRVLFRVLAMPLAVSAGNDINASWRDTVQLAATILANPGDTPVIAWAIVSKPPRSTAVLVDATTSTPHFTADAEGTYVLEVTATIPGRVRSDTVTVAATTSRFVFEGAIVDIEYTAGRFVLASNNPPRLRFLNPLDGTETSVALSFPPTAISVGLFTPYIAVAHAGHFSVVNSTTETLIDEFDVPFDVFDIVLDGSVGHLFMTQAGPIQTVDFSSREMISSVGQQLSGRTRAYRKPLETAIYGIDTTGPNPDIHRYSTYEWPVTYVRNSPYNGEYPIGGDLWFVQGNTRFVVRAGSVFNTTDDPLTDMTYVGRLGGSEPYLIESLTENDGEIVTLHNMQASPFGSPDHQLRIFDSTSFALREASPLPDLMINGSPQRSVGRYALLIDPNTLYLIISSGTTNALLTVRP